MSNILSDLQDLIIDHLKADSVFDEIALFSQETGNLENMIEAEIAKTGIVGLVLISGMKAGTRQDGDTVDLTVTFTEHTQLNRVEGREYATILDAVTRTWATLKRWKPNEYWSELLPVNVTIVSQDLLFPSYAVAFTTRIITDDER
jgi:hypothetical protein